MPWRSWRSARHGYTLLIAENANEAIAFATNHPDRIDLLITDVIMPVMMGHEVAAEIGALRPSTRIMYMSGYAQPLVRPDPGAAGGHDPDREAVHRAQPAGRRCARRSARPSVPDGTG